ncbi:uncharacterized protein PGTG_04121 [Puccinia graminis f. sp. tritici CRL 75-36-700-3]|uniref:Uncharacterized protein n=1 Tax=Puccinia graminis f. sp. tritici (strain CRL 75-36-700-3 / race SCCL) TaxID=418459 RepID=E3K1J0_PUCGT|nr:uncharacterized protein PGTG_04121 [Puccinia graminis f. sp. tritici CRL 75-36-700-3]EFP78165.1 hypothetical protein PGTG_04121 [Puccinia graminis f. sp. tritici CRL 75-36-700-3]
MKENNSNDHIGEGSIPAAGDALPIPSETAAADSVSPEAYGLSLEYQPIDEILASLQNYTEVTPNSEAAYSLELNALLAHDRQFAFENQERDTNAMSLTEGLYRNRAGRNGMATFRGPTKPLPHPKVAALRRRGKRDGRRKNRTPPSGVGTPPRPRGGAQGILGRRGRDAAEDAEEQARPTSRMRLA